MAFEDLNEQVNDFKDHAQSYMERSVSYYKLKGFELTTRLSSTIIQMVILIFFLSMVLLFCSLAGALALSVLMDSYVIGFLLVGGIYLAILLILLLFKASIIERPLLQKFSKIFYND